MRRFSETRREHPLAVGGSIAEGIRLERERLQGIRDMANQVIDTSSFNVHQLKETIQKYVLQEGTSHQMTVTLLSFGYSYGVPYEADLMIDVRFLPNPYFVEEMKRLEERIRGWPSTSSNGTRHRSFLRRAYDFIRFLLPLYQRERKTHLTIAVGCTGGRHRSVVIVNRLAEMLQRDRGRPHSMSVRHRDAEKG